MRNYVLSLLTGLICLCLYSTTSAQSKSAYDYYYAGIYMMEHYRNADAVAMFDTALTAGADMYDLYNYRGISYYNLGNYKAALDNYNYVNNHTTDHIPAYINAANALFKLGNFNEADKLADRILASRNYNAYAYMIKGNVSFGNRQYAEALSDYRLAIAADSSLLSPWYNSGLIMYELRQYDSAIYFHNHVRSLDAGDPANLYALAFALDKTDRTAESMAMRYAIIEGDTMHYPMHDSVVTAVTRDIELIKAGKMAISTPVQWYMAAADNYDGMWMDLLQQIFPNPATDDFTIQLKGTVRKPVTVVVVSQNGQLFRQYQYNDLPRAAMVISCKEWSPGTYTIMLVSSNMQMGKARVFVQR